MLEEAFYQHMTPTLVARARVAGGELGVPRPQQHVAWFAAGSHSITSPDTAHAFRRPIPSSPAWVSVSSWGLF
jgi:hypothetical protein